MPGQVVLADSFESGTFQSWTTVTVEGDAQVGIEWPVAHSGTCAGTFQVTTSDTSRANITKALPAGTSDVWAEGWFRVEGEGASNSNVGYLRFFDGRAVVTHGGPVRELGIRQAR
jgi:hypothetical protein